MKRLAILLITSTILMGCNGAAERRLEILREAQIVLRHSKTDFDFGPERDMLNAHIQEELEAADGK